MSVVEEKTYTKALYDETYENFDSCGPRPGDGHFGNTNARAWCGGWPIAAGVFGGLAVGTAIGATVASASAPTYAYPAYSYPVYPGYATYPAYTTYPAAGLSHCRASGPACSANRRPAGCADRDTAAGLCAASLRVYYSSPVVYAAPYPMCIPMFDLAGVIRVTGAIAAGNARNPAAGRK